MFEPIIDPPRLSIAFDTRSSAVAIPLGQTLQLATLNVNRVAIGFSLRTGSNANLFWMPGGSNLRTHVIGTNAGELKNMWFYMKDHGILPQLEWWASAGAANEVVIWEVIYRPERLLNTLEPSEQ